MISPAGHPCGSITPLRVLHIVLRVFIVAPYNASLVRLTGED